MGEKVQKNLMSYFGLCKFLNTLSKFENFRFFIAHPLSSSYAKILGETNFHTREIPRSGSKAEDGEKRDRERATHGARMAHAFLFIKKNYF